MALFGEIVEPTSRTAWEDWDEIDSAQSENHNTRLKWQKQTQNVSNIDTFFLFEGKYLSDGIKIQVDNKLELINSVPEANLNLFKEENHNRYICTVKDYNIVSSSEIVELLRPYIKACNNIVAIQIKPLSEYQTSAPSQDCVIRTVCTTKPVTLDLKYAKLEQPNIISGVAAGVIFLGEHLGSSGAALICYMEYPEDYDMDALHQLLGKLNILQHFKPKTSNILNSNLYI